jgi:hypothetical protein
MHPLRQVVSNAAVSCTDQTAMKGLPRARDRPPNPRYNVDKRLFRLAISRSPPFTFLSSTDALILPEEACIGWPIIATTEDGQYVGPYNSDEWRFDVTMNIVRKWVL